MIFFRMFQSQVIESSNAVAFRRAAASSNEGCWGKSTLLFQHKCVQQLRGTRKGGGVFEAAGKARAIYVVKRDEWCVLRLDY
jgi:hypothetical protein